MNEKGLKKISEQIGLKWDGKGNFAYGSMDGFQFYLSISPVDKSIVVTAFIKNKEDNESEKEIITFVEEYKRNDSTLKAFNFINHELNIHFTDVSAEKMNRFMKDIASAFYSRGYSNCCSRCGSQDFLSNFRLYNKPSLLCMDCFRKLDTSNGVNAEQERRENPVMGFVGALAGAIIGAILWVIIYKMGYIAGLAGFAICALALKGYEKLGRGLNKTGVVISMILTIAMVFIAQYISLALEIYSAYSEYGYSGITIFDCLKIVPEFLGYDDVKRGFILDLVVGYGLTVVASFSLIRKSFVIATGTAQSEIVSRLD